MKTLTSIFLSLLLIVTTTLPAFAAERDRAVVSTGISYIEAEVMSFQEVDCFDAPSYYYAFSNGSTVCSAYSLLTDNEKMIYDAVVNNSTGSFTVTISSPGITYDEYKAIDFSAVMYAICYDKPELLAHNGCGRGCSYYPSTGEVIEITYVMRPYSGSPYTEENISEYQQALTEVFDSLEFDLTTRYDFVKSVHDYLCSTITYVLNDACCYDAYGALVEKEAVCQGYAEAFKMICDYYKVPCICVTGTGVTSSGSGAHMWNAVQMDDGLWYLLDATWDDQERRIYYDFFLAGTTTKDTYFGGLTFSGSHIENGNMVFVPDVLYASTAYDTALKHSAFGATYNSVTFEEKKLLVLSFFDAQENNVYYDGMYLPIESYATDAVFSASTGDNGSNEDWRLALVGDCDGNGTADSQDLSVAVNKVLSDTQITTSFDYACDACNDGVLDALDIAVLERAVNGSNIDIILD